MTTNQNLERRLAEHFAGEAPNRAPDWILPSALTTIETTRQRRGPFAPWRFPKMQIYARVAAAMAIVAIGAVALWQLGGPGGLIVPTPSPSSSPTVAPSPTPAPTPQRGTALAFLPPFEYTLPGVPEFDKGTENGTYFEVRVPVWADAGHPGGLIVQSIAGGKADPCDHTSAVATIGPGPAAVFDYLRSISQVAVTNEGPATVGDIPARQANVVILTIAGLFAVNFLTALFAVPVLFHQLAFVKNDLYSATPDYAELLIDASNVQAGVPPTEASDIFSAGVALFEMATGASRLEIDGDTADEILNNPAIFLFRDSQIRDIWQAYPHLKEVLPVVETQLKERRLLFSELWHLLKGYLANKLADWESLPGEQRDQIILSTGTTFIMEQLPPRLDWLAGPIAQATVLRSIRLKKVADLIQKNQDLSRMLNGDHVALRDDLESACSVIKDLHVSLVCASDLDCRGENAIHAFLKIGTGSRATRSGLMQCGHCFEICIRAVLFLLTETRQFQMGFNTRGKFSRRKWFDEVVVSASRESLNPRFFACSCRQENDRDCRGTQIFPQPGNEAKAV